MSVKIVIADDHPLIAEGIKNVIETNKKFNVVKIVSNGKEAISYVENNLVDLLLLDIDMPIINGIECAEKLITQDKDIKIAILSMHEDPFIVKKVMNLGVKSYMLKTISNNELLFAIEKIIAGENYFNADITKAILEKKESLFVSSKFDQKSPLLDELTKREKEIIKNISLGLTSQEIADKLFISFKTVDTHRTNIMRKLDVHNVVSLVRFAIKNGLS
ncbi:response regulator transcription factor [uncultured Polaribacter sp.]|uniref:response regulator n=1 Tax=uncultured Polaribacter sp. TaxID=174711 RepID=UPI00261B7B32|nr:response regulator transcription factor [uncultured Polaribacter sp.]